MRPIHLIPTAVILSFAVRVPAEAQTSLWEWTGDGPFTEFGRSVAAGDVDADGFGDLLVGAPGQSPAGFDAGRALVYSGRTGALLMTIAGDVAGQRFGEVVADFADLDEDAHADLLVAAPLASLQGLNFSGFVRVISGATGATLQEWIGTRDFGRFGAALRANDDVDGDGFPDVLVGAPGSLGAMGEVHLYSGKGGSLIRSWSGTGTDQFGAAVEMLGDLDQDGAAEIAVGAPFAGFPRGEVYVYSGATGALITTLRGESRNDEFGAALRRSHDLSKNGVGDLVVGAPTAGIGGSTYVYSGATFGLLWRGDGAQAGERYGAALAVGPDMDGDHLGDLLVSAPMADAVAMDEGMVYVHSGIDGALITTFAGGSDSAHLEASECGDPDADGIPDFSLAAPGDRNETGRVRILSTSLAPRPLAVTPGRGHYGAPTPVTLTGGNFTLGSDLEIWFDDLPATNVKVLDDATLTCDAPAAEPGTPTITARSSLGERRLERAFANTPTLTVEGYLHPGGLVRIHYLLDPHDELVAIMGPPPPVSIPTPPYDGTLCIGSFIIVAIALDWPLDQFDLDLDCPDDPALDGADFLLQALIGPELFGAGKVGTWTNCVLAPIR